MSRNGFAECEREYNRREEEIEMAKEERKEPAMSDTPRTDEQIENWKWALEYPDDLDDVIEFARKLERELAEAKKKYLQVCAQHGRLVDQVYEEDGETLKHISAEARAAAAEKDARRGAWLIDTANEEEIIALLLSRAPQHEIRPAIDIAMGEKK